MKIIISMFHTTCDSTLYVFDDSLRLLKKITTPKIFNSKGVTVYGDRIIVAQKDKDGNCYLESYDTSTLLPLNMVSLKDTKDVHSLCVLENDILIVSTGTNEVHYYNLLSFVNDNKLFLTKKITTRLTSTVGTDSVHLNGICIHNNSPVVSGFGEIKNESRWSTAKNGFVLDLNSGEFLFKKALRHPHSVFVSSGDIYYCESLEGKIFKNDDIIFSTDEGYIRGLFVFGDYIYFGISSRNYKETDVVPSKSKIFKCKLNTSKQYEIIGSEFIGEDGAEIYDIILF